MFDQIRKLIADRLAELNVSWPGIIRAFDSVSQTVKVEVALKKLDGTKFTMLVDVPISLPTCQGFHLTMPIKAGDECLVIIADRCIDNWFSKGGVQEQAEFRVHDISDGFAIIGVNSSPNKIASYNADDAELRNTAGTQYIRMKANGDIQIVSPGEVLVDCDNARVVADTAIELEAPAISIVGDVALTGNLDVTGNTTLTGTVQANGKTIDDTHTHSGVTPGGGNTGGVN